MENKSTATDTQAALHKTDVKYQLAISALQAIRNPIAHFQQQLKDGEKLDGMYAVQLSNDAGYLKSIADKALTEIANCT